MPVYASSKDASFSTEYTSQTEAAYDHTADPHDTFATLRECVADIQSEGVAAQDE